MKEAMGSVLRKIDENGLIAFTRELVRIRSVYDPEDAECNEYRAASFVRDFLSDAGFEVHFEEVVPGRPNVVAVLNGIKPGKTLIFEGHTDVVTPGDPQGWSHDPFGGEVTGGRIYGRGACDTKGNVAAAIFAARALKDTGCHFCGRILLCIPCDEEGMMLGIKHFIKSGWADGADAAVICEPEENQLCIYQKGAIRIEVRIRGKQSHGAMPLSGINPNWNLARLILRLLDLETAEKERLGAHEYLGLPSITPTIVRSPARGEAQINVVPGEAYMTLDIRTVPGQEHAALIKSIDNIFKAIKAEDAHFEGSFEVIEERPWTRTDPEEPIVKAAAAAYGVVTGKEPVFSGVPGATDGTFLSAWKNIPVVVTGAGDRMLPHQKDEYVEIEELLTTCRLYAATALYFLGSSAQND